MQTLVVTPSFKRNTINVKKVFLQQVRLSVNIYIQIAYIEYQIVVDIYEVLTKPAYISLLLLCSRAGILLGYCFQLSLLAIKLDYLLGGDL
jgi:uncharacterized membrane protein